MATESRTGEHFFRNMALLSKSNLPLPDGARELAKTASDKAFKKLLNRLGDDLAKGIDLPDAMAAHGHFSDLQINLVRAAMQSDSLEVVLAQLAKFCVMQRELFNKLRVSLVIPALTMVTAGAVFLFVVIKIVPAVIPLYNLNLLSSHMHWSTRSMVVLHELLQPWTAVLFSGLGLVVGFIFWLYSGILGGEKLALILAGRMPGFTRVSLHRDYALLCGVLHMYLEQKIPLEKALEESSSLLTTPRIRQLLNTWSQALNRGKSFAEILADDKHADAAFRLSICHAPEQDLAVILGDLQDAYETEAEISQQSFIATLTTLAVMSMIICAGGAIATLFSPMIAILGELMAW